MTKHKHTIHPPIAVAESMVGNNINPQLEPTNIATNDLQTDQIEITNGFPSAQVEDLVTRAPISDRAQDRPERVIPGKFARIGRRLGALAAVGLSLGAAAPASAVELRYEGKQGRVEPYQTYDESSKIPTPHNGPIILKFGTHPRHPDARGALLFGNPSTMYLKPMTKVDLDGDASMQEVFDHERGHESDFKNNTRGERATFNYMYRGAKNTSWRVGASDPTPQEMQDYETFAEAYKVCSRDDVLNYRKYEIDGYRGVESVLYKTGRSRAAQEKHKDICKFIKRATDPNLPEQIFTPDITIRAKKVGNGRGTIKIADKTCPPKIRSCINREVDSNEPARIVVRAAKGSKVVGLYKGSVAVASRRNGSHRSKTTKYYEIPVQSLREASAANKKPALKLKIVKKK